MTHHGGGAPGPGRPSHGACAGDRRRHPRFPVGITLDIHARGRTIGRHRGAIHDLSIGGMAIRTDAELEEGATLYLKINIPLEIRGEVRHMKEGGGGGMRRYGVRFHKIAYSEPEASRPARFIAAQFQRKPSPQMHGGPWTRLPPGTGR